MPIQDNGKDHVLVVSSSYDLNPWVMLESVLLDDEYDAYIAELERVAEDAIETYLQRPLTDFIDPEQCTHQNMKPAIRHAIRLLVGTWYASREDVLFASATTLPNGVQALLLPLKKFA